MPLVVGAAGHIDHGKTWLVRALTGKDTDRLPEEHVRGISIDLGYAPLELPGGLHVSLVDVPGHARFVRNMVAGATGVDLFLLVVDAGEGARPQTHEHLTILRLLGVRRGVVAVTKADSVDQETLELAIAEAAELVPDAEVVPVSAKTGTGLDELRAALARAAESVDRPERFAATRLWIDRAFTLKGIGTVVTGTLWSGSIAPGDLLRLEPGGRIIRARSVQVHDQAVEVAEAGSAASSGAATRSSTRATTRSAIDSTSPSRRSSRCLPPSRCSSGLRTSWRAWCARANSHSFASRIPSSLPVATALSCGRRRRSGAAGSSTRRRLGGSNRSGSQ